MLACFIFLKKTHGPHHLIDVTPEVDATCDGTCSQNVGILTLLFGLPGPLKTEFMLVSAPNRTHLIDFFEWSELPSPVAAGGAMVAVADEEAKFGKSRLTSEIVWVWRILFI